MFARSVFDRSRATLVVLFAILAAGVVTFYEIPKEAEPEIELPTLTVVLAQTGLRAADADRLLVNPVARQLRTVAGVKQLRSTAYAGGATITLEFETPLIFGTPFDSERALAAVRERLDVAEADLPAEAKAPRLQQLTPQLTPLVTIALFGPLGEAEQLRNARALRDRLRALPVVADADIVAERKKRIEVNIDPFMLSSFGLDAEALIRAVNRANRAGASGGVDLGEGRLDLSVAGLFSSTSELLDLPIKANSDSVVRLRDVATARRSLEPRAVVARFNGQPATVIVVKKRMAAGVIDAMRDIRGVVAEESQHWPAELQADYAQDRSWRIRARIQELRNALVSAVLAVMVVVIAALGFRSGLLIAVAIPGSILTAVLGLALLEVPVNTIVLFAFVMSVGLLVDAAIVVVEGANRLLAQGHAPRDAYMQSAQRSCKPILCAIATMLAAFAPLLVWPGVLGESMRTLPLTLLLALCSSALMALVFIPVLGAVLHSPRASIANADARAAPVSRLASEYRYLLGWSLRHPGWTVGVALGGLVLSLWMYANFGRNVELLPDVEPTGATIHVRAPGDLSLAQKRDLALDVERIALGYEAIARVLARIGDVASNARGASDAASGVIAEFIVEFGDWQQRADGDAILADLERRLAGVSGVAIEVRAQRDGPGNEKPIQVDVTAASARDLEMTVAHVRNAMASIPGLVDLQDSRTAPGIEWQLHIDREQAARFGVDIATIEYYVRLVTRGVTLGALESNLSDVNTRSTREFSDRALDIVLRFPPTFRSVEGLRAIRMQTANGSVPLDLFADLRPVRRDGVIERVEGRLSRTVSADAQSGVLHSDLVRDIRAQLPSSALSPGAEVRIRGIDDDSDDAREFLSRAFVCALGLMALILILQLNSFYGAFVILLAVVLSSVGVRLGLLLLDMPYGIVMSGIGVVVLVGIVVNTNVVLIDTYARFRRDGHDPQAAWLLCAERRLRPILLTSLTTIAGLMPMVLGLDIDFIERTVAVGTPTSAYWMQMSTAVVFGLGFATVFTLFVTPAALMIRENISAARVRAKGVRHDESIQSAFVQHGPVIGVAAFTAIVAAWVFVPQLTAVRLIDIFSKQIFQQPPSSWFQALESAGFYCLVMLGAAYAYWRNDHVRVDIIRERLSPRGKAIVEIVGFVVLLAPVCFAVVIPGVELVFNSIVKEEVSGALLGTPTLWVFKALIVLCFMQLLAIGVYVSWKNVRFLRGRESAPYPPERSVRDAWESDVNQ